MKRKLLYAAGTLAAGTLAFFAWTVPGDAHHAFGAEFDRDAPIRLVGEVVRLEWVNPHSWIHLEVSEVETVDGVRPGEPGEIWMVEGGTPNTLVRRGLRRDCLPMGTVLIVDGYQAKNHDLNRANGRDVTFPDGRKFFLGSSGTGAPDDGAEQRARANPSGRC